MKGLELWLQQARARSDWANLLERGQVTEHVFQGDPWPSVRGCAIEGCGLDREHHVGPICNDALREMGFRSRYDVLRWGAEILLSRAHEASGDAGSSG